MHTQKSLFGGPGTPRLRVTDTLAGCGNQGIASLIEISITSFADDNVITIK